MERTGRINPSRTQQPAADKRGSRGEYGRRRLRGIGFVSQFVDGTDQHVGKHPSVPLGTVGHEGPGLRTGLALTKHFVCHGVEQTPHLVTQTLGKLPSDAKHQLGELGSANNELDGSVEDLVDSFRGRCLL